jgi:hypothetical protein
MCVVMFTKSAGFEASRSSALGDIMKENKIIGEAALSVEELRCLEAHFRQIDNSDAILGIEESYNGNAILSGKMRSELCFVEYKPPAA